MQTEKELLKALQNKCRSSNERNPTYWYTPEEHATILSLLSQQSEITGANKAWCLKDVLSKLIEASEILLHQKNYDGHGWEEIVHAINNAKETIALLNRQHAGSFGQLSQQEVAPIKSGDRFLTQEEFNRMYTHYSELCDKEDTNSWFENQFYLLKNNHITAEEVNQRLQL